MNTPSISGVISQRKITFKRTVTAVLSDSHGGALVHFEAQAKADTGSNFEVDVWPRAFDMYEGNTVDVYITITYGDTPLSTPQFGQVGHGSRHAFKVWICLLQQHQ